jgi:hypothetical protein
MYDRLWWGRFPTMCIAPHVMIFCSTLYSSCIERPLINFWFHTLYYGIASVWMRGPHIFDFGTMQINCAPLRLISLCLSLYWLGRIRSPTLIGRYMILVLAMQMYVMVFISNWFIVHYVLQLLVHYAWAKSSALHWKGTLLWVSLTTLWKGNHLV